MESSQTLVPIFPIISECVDSLTEPIIFCSSSTAVMVSKNDDMFTVKVFSLYFDDEEEFYQFYLGHRIDCVDDITTPRGRDILIYHQCDASDAKQILSAAFLNDDNVSISSFDDTDDTDAFSDFIDEYFI